MVASRGRDQAVRRGDLAALALRVGGELAPEAGDFKIDGQDAGAELGLQFGQPCQEIALPAAFGQKHGTLQYLTDGDDTDACISS